MPGIPVVFLDGGSVEGAELAERMLTQALDAGADTDIGTVTAIRDRGDSRVVFTEEYNCPLIDEILKTGLNALPVLFQPARADRGAYYVDLRFENGGLSRENLIRLESAGAGSPE